MKNYMIFLFGMVIAVWPAVAQDSENAETINIVKLQKQLVDVPTAAVLGKGQYEVGLRAFANGGLLTNINVGITDRFMIGISYGGEKFIGTGKINFNPMPGVDVRYRFIDESVAMPAIVAGFCSQGYGHFYKRLPVDTSVKQVDRYAQKSLGLFAVASKNYSFLGTIGFHGGINWAVTEKKDKDDEPSLFIGVDKSINPELSVVSEYGIAFNDNKKIIGRQRGYLNAGAKLNFNNKVMVEFLLKDILNNSSDFGKYSRELRLSFINTF